MSDNELDNFLDGLSPTVRRRAMHEAWGTDLASTQPRRPLFGLWGLVALGAGLPFAFLGVLLCATIVGIFPGVILIVVSGVPLYLVMRRNIVKSTRH